MPRTVCDCSIEASLAGFTPACGITTMKGADMKGHTTTLQLKASVMDLATHSCVIRNRTRESLESLMRTTSGTLPWCRILYTCGVVGFR